ncbi:tRNA (5-methylaminomethyl-2-thiouridine)(34)-methyltransferase MnmD [Bacteroides sp. UBA939]|uniref:tRNA (5-methylaminomethyl-2-thiouridine)(34)-methyltransferase MnmD n=1 Tax=Bacteroides sp. UBA939 TaxID=1946092 RepID=UPI0025C134EC|nr:tRNA (5-methylaminomethyl-2-thiouridine)(34)-methyltransferase MnmD [Bacteroides sp. UBA939]
MKRVIEHTEDGSATLFVPELDEHYHSVKGARTESQHIFIDMGLKASTIPQPHVLEIGFGTGLNALLTLEAAEKDKRFVYYTGIELYPLAWEEVEALGYSDNPFFKKIHTASWGEYVEISPYFALRKIQGDVNVVMSGECLVISDNRSSLITKHSSLNIVYFDAFAPEKQPEMWNEQLFRSLYDCMGAGGILTTYCAKGVVRRLLQSVGFCVERLPGPPGGKREMLRARKKLKVEN